MGCADSVPQGTLVLPEDMVERIYHLEARTRFVREKNQEEVDDFFGNEKIVLLGKDVERQFREGGYLDHHAEEIREYMFMFLTGDSYLTTLYTRAPDHMLIMGLDLREEIRGYRLREIGPSYPPVKTKWGIYPPRSTVYEDPRGDIWLLYTPESRRTTVFSRQLPPPPQEQPCIAVTEPSTPRPTKRRKKPCDPRLLSIKYKAFPPPTSQRIYS